METMMEQVLKYFFSIRWVFTVDKTVKFIYKIHTITRLRF
ncbi:hypothetical protein V2J09_014012 [Rumex salicifolius]